MRFIHSQPVEVVFAALACEQGNRFVDTFPELLQSTRLPLLASTSDSSRPVAGVATTAAGRREANNLTRADRIPAYTSSGDGHDYLVSQSIIVGFGRNGLLRAGTVTSTLTAARITHCTLRIAHCQ
jgi:hypothetical protein